jgi:hypothetical protein
MIVNTCVGIGGSSGSWTLRVRECSATTGGVEIGAFALLISASEL